MDSIDARARSGNARENAMAVNYVSEKIEGPVSSKTAVRAGQFLSGLVALAGLLVHANAHAIPIGDFNWNEHTQEECVVGLCGAFFSVDNFSTDPDISLGALGDTFSNVSVNLATDGGPLNLSLGDIAAGNSSQSIDDLSGSVIASALVALTFGLPGSIQLLDEFGNAVTALTAPGSLLIDYTAPVTTVPEPSTVLLLIGGLMVLAYAGRGRPKDRVARPRPDRLLEA